MCWNTESSLKTRLPLCSLQLAARPEWAQRVLQQSFTSPLRSTRTLASCGVQGQWWSKGVGGLRALKEYRGLQLQQDSVPALLVVQHAVLGQCLRTSAGKGLCSPLKV